MRESDVALSKSESSDSNRSVCLLGALERLENNGKLLISACRFPRNSTVFDFSVVFKRASDRKRGVTV